MKFFSGGPEQLQLYYLYLRRAEMQKLTLTLVPYRLISVKKNKNFFMQIRLLNQEVVQSKQLKAH